MATIPRRMFGPGEFVNEKKKQVKKSSYLYIDVILSATRVGITTTVSF